jgi:drug/metabolite transporter (DMT)-like permease
MLRRNILPSFVLWLLVLLFVLLLLVLAVSIELARMISDSFSLLGLSYSWAMNSPRALTGLAFATLLLIAFMMGANHVAARIAFNHGANVASAVVFRSLVTAAVVGGIVLWQGTTFVITARHKRFLPMIGVLIGVQSLCLYSAVARLPVALALLAFNTYPLWATLWDRVFYKRKPELIVLKTMPVILIGLALALDVFGAASGLGATAQWQKIGEGVAFAIAAGATFGLAMVLTEHEASALDGRVRTLSTLSIAALVALASASLQGGFRFPNDMIGWGGLLALTFLYGTAFTIMLSVLPKLGVAGNSAIMNVEPVFALVLAWLVLDQSISPIQLAGALLVVSAVLGLGLRKGRNNESA